MSKAVLIGVLLSSYEVKTAIGGSLGKAILRNKGSQFRFIVKSEALVSSFF
ncbi:MULTISPECIES: hypothetical protein [unclassified Wolbachia]|uniref:hypothetical protein n=1 Tax=unclassified Wolbachia TaxID=2640676 RepID=UPI00157AC63C|nr:MULTISPECIES: hypothetical protein [unclassified Wolbachia]